MDPDSKEKMSNRVSMTGMFVKILMASFPMLFVPQACDEGPCSMSEKVNVWKSLIFMNFMTFFSFVHLYYWQGTRETYMIDFFDEDDDRAENYLTDEIQKYPTILTGIKRLNKKLHFANKACVLTFFLNTVYSSSFILAERYLDTTTLTVLLTNSILVQGKLMQIHSCHGGDDLAQSSVGTKPKKYNVVDKDKYHLAVDESGLDISGTDLGGIVLEVPLKGEVLENLEEGTVSEEDGVKGDVALGDVSVVVPEAGEGGVEKEKE